MATIAVPRIQAAEERFRICADTGLRVHAKAETLIRVNLLTAVTFLSVGGLFGLTGKPIPDHWTAPWNERVGVSLAGESELSLGELVARTVAVADSIGAGNAPDIS